MTQEDQPGTRTPAWRAAVLPTALFAALVAMVAHATAGGAPYTASPASVAAAALDPAPRIDIRGFEFSAASLTVPVGTTVTWTNEDEEPHTVTAADRLFASSGLDTGESFSFTFTTPGTYRYFCALHPHMTGTIVVR